MFGSKLSLLHAYDPKTGSKEQALEYLQTLREERCASIEQVELIAAPHRSAALATCAESMARGVDLIVAGRHGEHNLKENLLGSTTERVVRHAHCSTWVVHPATREHILQARHIAAANDLSEESIPRDPGRRPSSPPSSTPT